MIDPARKVADLEGFLARKRPKDSTEDVLKLKFLEGSATPLFRSRGTSLPG